VIWFIPQQTIIRAVPLLQPMALASAGAAFSHPDWIFNLK